MREVCRSASWRQLCFEADEAFFRVSSQVERRDHPIMTDGPNPLRIVIQQLGVRAMPRYRVIVYGDEQRPLHSDFDGGQTLLDTLHSAIPDFNSSQLSLKPMEEGKGSIVFTGEVDLDKWQLAILGLG
jgi:hypothetical protein